MNAPPRPHPSRGTILLLGSLTAFGAVTIDLYLPALPAIGRDFGVGPAETQHTLVAFFMGVAIGQLFYGPISDRIGRRPPLLFGVALYIAASLACTFATGINGLIAGRFVQALGCCSGMVIARSVVRDRFDHQDSARIFSLLTLVLAVAPMIAPTLGGWLVMVAGWRWVFGALAMIGAAVGLATFLKLGESRSAETEAKARGETPLAAYVDLMRQRRLLGYLLTGALNGATLFAYVASAPDLVINIWGLSPTLFGLVFAVMAIGIIGASQVNRQLLLRYSSDRILGTAVLAGVGFGAALTLAAATGAHRWVVFVMLFATLSSNGFIGANALAGALSVDPLRSGSASGLFGASSFGAGAGSAAVAGAFHDGTPVPMAVVMLASLAAAAAAFFGLARPRTAS
ncbi:multidrug effflux MFS transporter [Glacieibacterium sp.]|uniref:multidrug effflux MFS transporter n=1 Tax=Glacieibacterium sp. TaxID=2860237 RepID=UPI003AFFA7F1